MGGPGGVPNDCFGENKVSRKVLVLLQNHLPVQESGQEKIPLSWKNNIDRVLLGDPQMTPCLGKVNIAREQMEHFWKQRDRLGLFTGVVF